MKTTKTLILVLLTLLSGCHVKKYNQQAENKHPDAKEILLLGTFHYNNPGADAVKSDVFDVMTEDGQNQLEELANNIAKYKPSKIFVEWNLDDQVNLDKDYNKYLAGRYFDDETLNDFQRKNEIFQLAFRVAKKLGHQKVYAVDNTNVSLDFPAVMQAIDDAKQDNLKQEFNQTIQRLGKEASERISNMSLEELYIFQNQVNEMSDNIELYTQLTIKAGDLKSTAAVDMISNWYKRNLFIWSNIQKQVTQEDNRVMVLFGAGHTAILDQIIAYNRQWQVTDLRKVLTGFYYEADF